METYLTRNGRILQYRCKYYLIKQYDESPQNQKYSAVQAKTWPSVQTEICLAARNPANMQHCRFSKGKMCAFVLYCAFKGVNTLNTVHLDLEFPHLLCPFYMFFFFLTVSCALFWLCFLHYCFTQCRPVIDRWARSL